MKKNGYTLAEVLVTLGIIGIIAGITGPLITKFTPDAEKVAYLKTYDMLSKTINEIARNRTFYLPIDKDENENGKLVNFTNAPLMNLSDVEINGTKIKGGHNKIAKLFGYYTGLKKLEELSNIKDAYQSKYEDNPDFITKDGAAILMTTKVEAPNGELSYQTDVYVDINGTDKGKNCHYDSITCVKPDIFKFILTASGELFPADAMGNYYLTTRNSWKASKDIAGETPKVDTSVKLDVIAKDDDGEEEDDGEEDDGGEEDDDGEEYDGIELIFLPYIPQSIKITPSTPGTPSTPSTPGSTGGGSGDSTYDPCNYCGFDTVCKNGLCVNPNEWERNKNKIQQQQDWASSIDAPLNLKDTMSKN